MILLADDLGYQDIGCYGGPVKTPTLDALATRGTRFSNFYSGCAVCSPSRATLIDRSASHSCRRLQLDHRSTARNSHLLLREMTLAELFKTAGYATAHVGKWHLGLPTPTSKSRHPTNTDLTIGLPLGTTPAPVTETHKTFFAMENPWGRSRAIRAKSSLTRRSEWIDRKTDRTATTLLFERLVSRAALRRSRPLTRLSTPTECQGQSRHLLRARSITPIERSRVCSKS